MKNILNGIWLLMISLMVSCSTPKTVIQNEETVYHYIDSVIYKDSVTLIPQEYYYNVAWPYDTLHLETSQASAVAWVDSTFLHGYIKNKKVASQQIIEKTEYITKDSIVYKEKPVPYEVVKEVKNPTNTGLVIWTVLSGIGLVAFIVWKVYKVLF